MKKAFREYLFSDFLFQLSMYQKVTIDIESFTKTRTKDLQSGYDYDDCLDVYETRYSEDFQHFLNFFYGMKSFMDTVLFVNGKTHLNHLEMS